MTTPLTERQRTDRLIDQMFEVAKRKEARHELEPLSEEIIERPLAGALLALERNAEAHPSRDTSIRPKLISAPQSIEQTGCTFIDSTLLLLQHLECPPDVRLIVLCICGLTGGDYTHFTKITQGQMAKRLGISPDTVRERLDELIAWEKLTNRTVIEIKKQERDHATRHFGITEYRPIVVPFAAEYIRRITAKGLPSTNRQQTLTPDAMRTYKEVAEEIADDMPLAVALIPRTERNITPPQERFSFIEGKEQKILKAIDEWRDALLNHKYEVRDYSPELLAKIEDRIRRK